MARLRPERARSLDARAARGDARRAGRGGAFAAALAGALGIAAAAEPALVPVAPADALTAWLAGGRVQNEPGPIVRLPPGAGGDARAWLEAPRPTELVCGLWANGPFELKLAGKTVAKGPGGGELVLDWLEGKASLPAGRSELAVHVGGASPKLVAGCRAIASPGGYLVPLASAGVIVLVPAADPAALDAEGLGLSLGRSLVAPVRPGALALEAHYSWGRAARATSADWHLGFRVLRAGTEVGVCPADVWSASYGCAASLVLPAGRYEVEATLELEKRVVRRARWTVDHDPAAAAALAEAAAALSIGRVEDLEDRARAAKLSPVEVQATAALREAVRLYGPLEASAPSRKRALAAARLAVARVRGGAAALAAERGLGPRGIVSRHDGLVQVYGLYLPPGKLAGRPLVVGLHGAGTSGTDFCQKLLGGAKAAPGILVCPDGYGPSGFLHAGTEDALDVLGAARALGPADPARIYVTGGSHGGVGTYALALGHPGLFAAAAVLSGSADMAIFPSIAGKPLAPHEGPWLRARAFRSWAANARNVAFKVVHGAKDSLAVAHAAVFKEAMDAAGLPLDYTVHPDLGHDVWTRTYAGGALWRDFLDRHAKPAAPAEVWLTTPGQPVTDAWATLWRAAEELPPMELATLRARAVAGRIEVETKGVAAVTLAPPAALAGDLVVDGTPVPRDAPALWRRGKAWEPGPPPAAPWREGPLDAVRSRPLRFAVDGIRTLGLAFEDRDRLLAGMRIVYPIAASPDVKPSPELRKSHSLMLYGHPGRNRLLAEVLAGSPISVDDGGVTVAGKRFGGKDVGVRAILPSPWSAREYVVVSAGPGESGVRCAVWLPEVLPDWAVCTSAALVRPGGMVLGETRRLLGAGFWGRAFWRKAEGTAPLADR